MDDLIRREALIEDIVNAFTRHGGSRDDFLKHIQFAPAIDAVHAAGGCYCGECIHYKPQKQSVHWNHEALYCRRTTTMKMSPTDYCSKGERRNDNAID